MNEYCWRCRLVPVRVHGVPCRSCRLVLDAQYDAAVAANGGKLLYIPDDWRDSSFTELANSIIPEPS